MRGTDRRPRNLWRAQLDNRLNLLLALAPASWAVAWLAPASPWLFVVAALSVIPLAGLIGRATDQLATETGPTLGGFLNATFGNAAELIIGIVALRRIASNSFTPRSPAASWATCCWCSACPCSSAGSDAVPSASTGSRPAISR